MILNKILVFIVSVFFLAGCSVVNPKRLLPAFQSPQVLYHHFSAIEVQSAIQWGDSIAVEFSAQQKEGAGHRIFHVQADDLSDGFSNGNDLKASIVHLISKQQWNGFEKHANTLDIIGREDWSSFRDYFLRRLVSNKGHSVRIQYDSEYQIVFLDDNDVLQYTFSEQAPEGLEVIKEFTPEGLILAMTDVLPAYLSTKIDIHKSVIFTVDSYSSKHPTFLYWNAIDESLQMLHLPIEHQKKSFRRVKNKARAMDHILLNSYVNGSLTDAFSRLFFFAAHSAYDLVKPTKRFLLDVPLMSKSPVPEYYQGPGMDLKAWESTLDKITNTKSIEGHFDLLIDGEEFFEELLSSFKEASQSIFVRTYIFDNDDYAVKVADVLKERQSAGIDVRILLDGLGTVMAEGSNPDSMPKNFLQPDSITEYFKKSDVKVRLQSNPWLTGDHTKTIIIDEKKVFTGGMNIGREYRFDWHDMMVSLKGPIVNQIRRDFHKKWANSGPIGDLGYLAHFFKIKKNIDVVKGEGYPIRLLYTKARNSQIYKAQIAAIRNAKKYIYIQNSYFSDDEILYELVAARRRGVDVRVILPFEGNHQVMNGSNIVTANTMFKYGIRVFFYPGMSHVKAALYDGWACFGSANFDRLSLRVNEELNLATSHPESVKILLDRLFVPDFEKSVEMKEPFRANWKNHLSEILANQL